MELLTTGIKSYPQDPTRFFDFKRFKSLAGNYLLVENFIDFDQLFNFKDKKIVYLEFEEPNRFFVDHPNFNHIPHEDLFYKIFTICPYSAKWLNRKFGNAKRTFVFFPFNENYIPLKNEKLYDVIYTGHILGKSIEKIILDIQNFNYRLVSNSDSNLVTNKNASYLEKLDLISKSRITIVHNLLYPIEEQQKVLKKNKDFRNSDAYKSIPRSNFFKINKDKEIEVPQIKSRLFEAAFCRSLILCKRDKWNVIENFFEADVDFVYYEEGKLVESIQKILKDFNKYEFIINNAFEKAKRNYTTEVFFNKYLRSLV